jgi:hypothetical protein
MEYGRGDMRETLASVIKNILSTKTIDFVGCGNMHVILE